MTVLVTCFRCGKAVLARKETLASKKPPYCMACRNSLGLADPEDEAPKLAAPAPRNPRTTRVAPPPRRVSPRRPEEDEPRVPQERGGSSTALILVGVLVVLGVVTLGVFVLVGVLILATEPAAKTPSEERAANGGPSSRDPAPQPVEDPPARRFDPPVVAPPPNPQLPLEPPVVPPVVPPGGGVPGGGADVTQLHTTRMTGAAFRGLAFNPRGDNLAVVCGFGGAQRQVRFYQISPYKHIGPTISSGWDYFGIAYRPDGSQFAVAAGDGGLQLFAIQGGAPTTFRFPSYVRSVAFAPDGSRVAGNCERRLAVLEPATSREVWGVEMEGKGLVAWRIPTRIAFSPDGKALAAGHGGREVVVHDAATGAVRVVARGHDNVALCTAWTPDSRTLFSGGLDKAIKVWDPTTGAEVRTLRGHTDWVYCLALSPDGRTLASAGREGAVILWDVASGRLLTTLPPHTKEATSVAFSPDGRSLASCGTDGVLMLWDVSRVGKQ